jgi:hypothetical protein
LIADLRLKILDWILQAPSKLHNSHQSCHPERSIIVREANDYAESKNPYIFSNPASAHRPEGLPNLTAISGALAQLLPHDEDPYVVGFPAQEFVLNGARQKMRPLHVKAAVVRWKIGKDIIAYSYELIPVTAHRVGGQWKIETEWGCIFTTTFIDDTGDGVFRVLVPGAHTEDLVPRWAKQPES